MTSNPEMTADLREIIAMDLSAQVKLIYMGRTIIGTKGNIALGTVYDRDGGGTNSSDDSTATFVADDFPSLPDGNEIVTVDSRPLRVMKANYDDFNVACVIDFTSVTEI